MVAKMGTDPDFPDRTSAVDEDGHGKSGSVPIFADEGDVNLTPRRQAWERNNVGPQTRALLDRDAAVFLHQSLSTPCFGFSCSA